MSSETHVLAFWEGWSLDDKESFSTILNESSKVQCICLVESNRGRRNNCDSFPLQYGLATFMFRQLLEVQMCGSGQQFCAYILSRPTNTDL